RRRNLRPPRRRNQDPVRIAQHVRSQVPQLHNLSRSHPRFERGAELPAMKSAISIAIVFAGLAASGFAQPVVAPTPETVGSPRGEDAGGYNIVNSFETGYRFADIGGNRDKYRSDVNFRNGIRLFSSG